MDEHSGALPQPTGDVQVFFLALLCWLQENHQSLPWNTRRSSAGSGARIQRLRHKVQRYPTVAPAFTCWAPWTDKSRWHYWSCKSSLSFLVHAPHSRIVTNTVAFMIPADEVMQTTYCEIDLDKAKRDAFVYAIKNHYWYQMYIDDLPIWGKWYQIFFKNSFWVRHPPQEEHIIHVRVVACIFWWCLQITLIKF